jgi:hypothetical protein
MKESKMNVKLLLIKYVKAESFLISELSGNIRKDNKELLNLAMKYAKDLNVTVIPSDFFDDWELDLMNDE